MRGLQASDSSDPFACKKRPPITDTERGTVSAEELITRLGHEVQNALQGISTGVSLLCSADSAPAEARAVSQSVVREIKLASRLVREVCEYVSPPAPCLSVKTVKAVVEEVTQQVATEWAQPRVSVRIKCHDPLLSLTLDWHQFRLALARLLSCSYALLPHGGQLHVETRLRAIKGHQYLALPLTVISPSSLPVTPKDVWRPFLRIQHYQVGLSLLLVQERLQRQQGALWFRKENARQARFTLWLKVPR